MLDLHTSLSIVRVHLQRVRCQTLILCIGHVPKSCSNVAMKLIAREILELERRRDCKPSVLHMMNDVSGSDAV